ncbi:hypothetical protein [Ekhidna sp.]
MRYLIALSLIIVQFKIAYSQNIVNNGSFEIRQAGTNCPNGPWNTPGSTQGFPRDWTYGCRSTIINGGGNTINGTPDYLQTCSSLGSGYNPANHIYGSEVPRTGTSMTGIIAASPFSFGGTSAEYLIYEFDTPLQMGAFYSVEFFVSLADDTEYAVKGLGAYFTSNFSELVLDDFPLNYSQFTPQVPSNYPSPFAFLNSNGWSKVSGTYSPNNSNVKYMVLGNFATDQSQLVTNPGHNDNNNAYYYIDDVSIEISGFNQTCSVQITDVGELNALGQDEVTFLTTTTKTAGTQVTGGNFLIYFENGDSFFYPATVNFLGNTQVSIPVSCSNKVTSVVATVFASNSNINTNCNDSYSKNFTFGVCGTGGGFGGFQMTNNSVIEVNILQLNGDLVKSQTLKSMDQVDFNGIKSGLYIIQTMNNNHLTQKLLRIK